MAKQKESKPRENRERDRDTLDEIEFIEKLICVNRVTKVVKGGKRMAFAALVVVGDQAGRVGYGHGRAREVPEAVAKASERARRELVRVPLKEGRTLHHPYKGCHGAGAVILRPAVPGTGIIAGGPVRAIFEALGVQDVVGKLLGSSNSYNAVYAAFNALRHQESPRMVAQRRGKSVREVMRHRFKADEHAYGG